MDEQTLFKRSNGSTYVRKNGKHLPTIPKIMDHVRGRQPCEISVSLKQTNKQTNKSSWLLNGWMFSGFL